MIDLHCHILPGLDDGASSLDEACYMARLAVSDGIKAIIATPHVCNGVNYNDRDRIALKVATVNDVLERSNIPLKVVPGAQVQLVPKLKERLCRGDASTINNSRYVLIDLPKILELESAKDEIFALRMNGYVPVLAHPERHPKFQHDVGYLNDFVELGVFCQITAASLTGGFGREVKYVAEKMVVQGMIHVLATDSHASTWREPILSAALKKVSRLLGSEKEARRMVVDMPMAIIANRDIAVEIPGHAKRVLQGKR